jgi:DnaJ-class molecular chaperone
MASSGEPAGSAVCETCSGEGGMGDERCAMIICPDCDGSGVQNGTPSSTDHPAVFGTEGC